MSKEKKGGLFQAIKEFAYGVAAHDSARFALKSRASMEHLFILITMGDMLAECTICSLIMDRIY